MSIVTSIFKAYDIRGLVATELSTDLAYRLGRAFVRFLMDEGVLLAQGAIVVGRDMRETSPAFQEAVIHGITDEGVAVVDIGECTTPLFNFACAEFERHLGGIMVTASHNPAEYNGFKMTRGNGLPIGGDTGMDTIRDLVVSNTFGDPVVQKGAVDTFDVLPDYKKKIFSLVPPTAIKPLKIVIDAGNGMGKATFPSVLADLPVEVEYLYLDPDGNFPNHEANPLKVDTLEDLQAKVRSSNADLGFALDGDADRVGLVDEKGNVVDASFVGALVGLEVLRQHKKGKMFYDLRSSMIVREVWEAQGAEVGMCMVGHAPIKNLLKKEQGIFASELSLHLYFGDMYDVECTDLVLLYVLAMMSREQKPLSELVEPLKKYFHSGEINFEVEAKDVVMQKIENMYGKDALEISHLDGLWMRFDWGWFSVRKSNTEPVLRLNLETYAADMLTEKVTELSDIIRE